jgi:tetrahydromethanopterin S-methyltransferase subunit G
MTTSSLEERMARLEGSFEQIERRLGNIEQDMRSLRSDLNTRFSWLMGTTLGMWVTIILAVLLRG